MQILKTGSTGAEVALLQLSLRRAQYGAPAPDGVFGGATKSALQAFQRSHGLTPDGIFGAETERALAPWLRGYAVHTVRPGDTLFSLAERYDASLGAIETANPALDPFALRPGQRITVPLPFSVVPTDIPWCSALMDCAVDGLTHRYPQLRAESIGHSALSRPIWALTAGDGLRRVLYSAAHHANEWITTPLLMKYLETLLRAAAAGETVFGYPAEDILFRAALTLVPLVDPDGVDLVTGALPEGEAKERTAAIAAAFPAIPYSDGWKANIAGIDLNLQYPAGWDTARAIKFAQGYDRPAPRDFVGEAPLTAPEAAALSAFTEALDPALVLAYHTQGNVIYWKYLNFEPEGSRALAERFAAVSGYACEDTPYASGFAGYKDWFIQNFDRPGYTIECGLGENPLPLSQFESIWNANLGILTLAALGI